MVTKAISAVRKWWFLRQCQQVERLLAYQRADAEIRLLQAMGHR
jgi:hypothetical protein